MMKKTGTIYDTLHPEESFNMRKSLFRDNIKMPKLLVVNILKRLIVVGKINVKWKVEGSNIVWTCTSPNSLKRCFDDKTKERLKDYTHVTPLYRQLGNSVQDDRVFYFADHLDLDEILQCANQQAVMHIASKLEVRTKFLFRLIKMLTLFKSINVKIAYASALRPFEVDDNNKVLYMSVPLSRKMSLEHLFAKSSLFGKLRKHLGPEYFSGAAFHFSCEKIPFATTVFDEAVCVHRKHYRSQFMKKMERFDDQAYDDVNEASQLLQNLKSMSWKKEVDKSVPSSSLPKPESVTVSSGEDTELSKIDQDLETYQTKFWKSLGAGITTYGSVCRKCQRLIRNGKGACHWHRKKKGNFIKHMVKGLSLTSPEMKKRIVKPVPVYPGTV